MITSQTIALIRRKYEIVKPELNERAKRYWASSEAIVLGYGGLSAVHKATGIAISTIRRGIHQIKNKQSCNNGGIRKKGGGRKKLTEHDPDLIKTLDSLIEPTTRGDPMSPLRWTCKSTRKLAQELTRKNHPISHSRVSDLLHKMKYSLQSNKKTIEGADHPDRDKQFRHINNKVKKFQKQKQPVISVDAKKKENVGNFKNNGREWRPKGQPEKVNMHDFPDKKNGKVAPYGVYDITRNQGWVNVGIDKDTAQFAVESIRRWWKEMGRKSYSNVKKLLITADGGGSNGRNNRLWKSEIQKFANETGLSISICHFPPGTSKWNKIEHKLFSFITKNWRGRPLIDHATIVNLIASTTNKNGLKINCRLDKNKYPTGIKISDEVFEKINIKRDAFHEEWNYSIHPKYIKV